MSEREIERENVREKERERERDKVKLQYLFSPARCRLDRPHFCPYIYYAHWERRNKEKRQRYTRSETRTSSEKDKINDSSTNITTN